MLGHSPRFSQGAYRVEPMITADSVIYAIRGQRRPPNPDYVKAVLRSYVDVKLARGKTKGEADYKFTILERELSEYGGIFRAVREETGLRPPTRTQMNGDTSLRRAVSSQPTSSLTPGQQRIPSINRTNTAAASTSTSRRASSVIHPTPVTTTLRPTTGEDEELPPPPYARQDPEPDSTRLLQERLAAEELAGGGVAVGLERPDIPPTPSTPTPSVTVYASPPGPPPQSRSPAASSARPPISDSPPHTPTDPDVARVWEESQMEEAKRASRAAERERLELEEAIRLSVEEAEASGIGLDDYDGGGGGGGGSSRMDTVLEDEDLGGRRFSSYNPASGSSSGMGGQEHRRVVSDVSGLEGGMQGMSVGGAMPGGWGGGHGLESLMDDDADMRSGNVLIPEKTGTVLKSNNPFLSPAEREESQSAAGPSQHENNIQSPQNQFQGYTGAIPATPNTGYGSIGMGSPSPSLLPPQTPASRQPSNTSLRDNPGSSYTTFSPPPTSSPSQRPLPQTPKQDVQNSYGSPHQVRSSPQTPVSAPRLPPRAGTANTNTGGFGWDQNPSFALQEKGNNRLSMSGPYPTFSPSSPPVPPKDHNNAAGPSQTPSGVKRRSIRDIVKTTGEDPLETLRDFDTVFLVDDSASMAGERWESAKNALMGVAEVAAEYDEDGIDIYFLNSKRVGRELKTAADVEELFAGLTPRGATPTGVRLDLLLREYLGRLERSGVSSPTSEIPGEVREVVKPMNLIVVTDGDFARPVLSRRGVPSDIRSGMVDTAPTDDPESVIINAAKRLDRGDYPLSQVGIQFLQIGDDVEAREAFQQLDDGLSAVHDVRDIVDTVLYNGEAMTAGLIIKTLLGGINRRLDRRGHGG